MRSRIQRSMIMLLTITLLTSYVVFAAIAYYQNLGLLKAEVRQEAKYIATAIDIFGETYLEAMDDVDENTRLTRIAEDGIVLYDSKQDEIAFENHKDRHEVKEAFANGTGEDIRVSNSLGSEQYYYALLLQDGTVLRVSKTMGGLISMALQMMPVLSILAILMLAASYLIAVKQTERLIKPINELDLEHPLDNEIYVELTPLLTEMERQNREKEAISNMRKEFSANVSHELKTPLTSISGYAEIMKNGLVRPQDMQNFAERIYKEARRLISLVEDTIKLSKLDEEAVELEKEEVDLYQLCRETVSRLSPLASQKKVHMSVSGERVLYVGIRQILDEMIYNICENAIKYNKEGGSVDVWAGENQEGIIVQIKDTGIGIPVEYQERVFERFFRVDKSHSKETGGTGLGLSIVKHGAILHGAHVEVESDVGQGTAVTIKF
ncbi:MAG: ATP-binding protein [Schaedlerella sp.]|nr:ATP-binding protein [Schaedlerella sp.]